MATKTIKRISKAKPQKAGKKPLASKKGGFQTQKYLGALKGDDTRERDKAHSLIDQLPADRLKEVNSHLNNILSSKSAKSKDLRGNLADRDLEMSDIEALKEARDAMLQGTLNKNYE